MKLLGQRVVITGGNSGKGFGVARRFEEEGATGFVFGRNPETLHGAERALNGRFEAVRADVTKRDDLSRAFEHVGQSGGLDVLVVNAGGAIGAGSFQPLEAITETALDSHLEVNLKSVFLTVQQALPYLNVGSCIVLVASIASHKGFANMSVYSACKAGVRALARGLAIELLERAIRINVISPGTIDTPVFERIGMAAEESRAVKEGFSRLIPMNRLGTPADIAGAALFLASDDAGFITGEEIIVDGGVVNL